MNVRVFRETYSRPARKRQRSRTILYKTYIHMSRDSMLYSIPTRSRACVCSKTSRFRIAGIFRLLWMDPLVIQTSSTLIFKDFTNHTFLITRTPEIMALLGTEYASSDEDASPAPTKNLHKSAPIIAAPDVSVDVWSYISTLRAIVLISSRILCACK